MQLMQLISYTFKKVHVEFTHPMLIYLHHNYVLHFAVQMKATSSYKDMQKIKSHAHAPRRAKAPRPSS